MPETLLEGVYLCDRLDLAALFAPSLADVPGARLYRPGDVPDPARIRFALAWRPAPGAFAPYPGLRMVQSIAAGVDGILSEPSLPGHAAITRVRDPEQARIMAGFAAWHVVWHHRDMGVYVSNARQARWERISFDRLRPPSRVTVGVLGYGLMGRAIARAVAALGFRVIAASARARPADEGVEVIPGPDAVARTGARADILINVLPLTPATDRALNAAFFARMPEGAALIQLGRGEHLVEGDLLAALDSGHLGGASLDVFRAEPLPPDHPFWRHPRVLVTPHEASVIPAGAVARSLAQSLAELRAGAPFSAAVDRALGY